MHEEEDTREESEADDEDEVDELLEAAAKKEGTLSELVKDDSARKKVLRLLRERKLKETTMTPPQETSSVRSDFGGRDQRDFHNKARGVSQFSTELQRRQKSRRIGCVIPPCKLQCGITQPILQLF